MGHVESSGSSDTPADNTWVVTDSLPFGSDSDQTLPMNLGDEGDLPVGVGELLQKEAEALDDNSPHDLDSGLTKGKAKKKDLNTDPEEKPAPKASFRKYMQTMCFYNFKYGGSHSRGHALNFTC